jgi:hypothetical protein
MTSVTDRWPLLLRLALHAPATAARPTAHSTALTSAGSMLIATSGTPTTAKKSTVRTLT